MKKVVFECETVTPMFLAGADGVTPELRPPSIKGMMRFWWRALNGHLVGTDFRELKKKEAEIFGSSDEKIGRSRFNLNVNKKLNKNDIIESLWKEIPNKPMTSRTGNKYNVPTNYEGISYLLYSTLMVSERPYIKSGTSFSIQILSYDEKILQDSINSLYVLALLGGLGTRNRRGAGSFRVRKILSDKDESYKNILDTNNIKSKEDMKKHLELNFNLILKSSACLSYSILKNSKIYILDPKENWKDALETLGKSFKNFRKINENKISETPNFGFPINHGNVLMGAGPQNHRENTKGEVIDFFERRASPLIFKIIKTMDKNYFPVIVWLNGELIPSNYNIMDKKGYNIKKSDEKFIIDFLNTVTGKLQVNL